MRLATLPVGYADGFRRLLGAMSHNETSPWHVLVRGQRAPLVGRVCMDMCMVDVSHVTGVHVGDEVVLIGRQGRSLFSSSLSSISSDAYRQRGDHCGRYGDAVTHHQLRDYVPRGTPCATRVRSRRARCGHFVLTRRLRVTPVRRFT